MRRNQRRFVKNTLARQLGFKNAKDRRFSKLLRMAEKRGLIKIKQGGFIGDSMHHPKIVYLLKPLDFAELVKQSIFPSWLINTDVKGYSLKVHRTGKKRLLKTGKFSSHQWWVCEDCDHKIKIGEPYASKIDFSKHESWMDTLPVCCKCLPCFLDMVTEEQLMS